MKFLDKIFNNKEEAKYKAVLRQVSMPLMGKISLIKEKNIRMFFEKIVDVSEKVLRSLLFETEIIDYKKELTKEEFDYWIKKVSLAMIACSYYCVVLVKNWYGLDNIYFKRVSYVEWFNKVFNYYNQIFNKNITKKDMDYYASGYKEDAERGYSKTEDQAKVLESCKRDYETIGSELLKEIWCEDIKKENYNKRIIIGTRIWEAHRQLIRPYLEKLA